MIYLNRGLFKPCIIFLTVILLPIIVLWFFAILQEFEIGMLVLFLLFVLAYCLGVYGAYRYARSTKYWLSEQENTIVIKYPNVVKDYDPITLDISQIVKMEYCKLSSIASWIQLLHTYVFPQCVFITYVRNGEEGCKLIGYPDREEIRAFCKKNGIQFEVR